MNDNRLGGAALIVASLSSLLVMLHHPTGHDLLSPGGQAAAVHRNVVVHGMALAAVPLMLLGTLALTQRLRAPNRLAVMAFVTYAFASAAVTCAAVMSGLVAPRAVGAILESGEGPNGAWHMMLRYTAWLNRGFAQVFVVASAVAILLWALAILRGRGLALWAGWLGIVVCLLVLAVAFSGHMWDSIHVFGLVVLAEAVWFVAVGVLLWAAAPAATT
ncbi:MAG TPA: hypothetical protein VGV61_11180 [Thermoanaerobaculia bacterium]|nr:hypothetical protein [Thermoanaerobaculia bacterium]